MNCVRVTVARTAGSVPREAGTSMLVWADRTNGTIGGGALEWQAMAEAREMLNTGAMARQRTVPLGPALGQCCGGSVSLTFEAVAGEAESTTGQPLWIWGAGHVGRALVDVLGPLPDFDMTWVDTGDSRFPEDQTYGLTRVTAADMPRLAAHAPQDAGHLIVTYSHEIDLALCHALLTRGFAHCGLIGSATKWARFRARLVALGHGPEQIARIACPIGDPTLGKHPQAIAVGVAATLLKDGGDALAARGSNGERDMAG